MVKSHFPFIKLPVEFLTLLKSNLVIGESAAPIFDVIRPNQALYEILDMAFTEFNDGRGLEKLFMTLGWPNFRDRMASLYVFKSIYGRYPTKTSLELVQDISDLENRFRDQSVHSYSRLFLLGFYLKLANLHNKNLDMNQGLIFISPGIEKIIKSSPSRTERIDWLILIVMHLTESLGESVVMSTITSGTSFEELYQMMDPESKSLMTKNCLTYAASIHDPEIFLYEKV